MPAPKPIPPPRKADAPHRNKHQVTIDRLCRMSPYDLKTLGQRLAEHEAGEHVLKMIYLGAGVKQERLPGIH